MPTESEIKSTLRRLGVKTTNRGYSYVTYGILLTLKDKNYLEYITKNLDVDIAHNYNTSDLCEELDIRTTLEAIWNTDHTELLMEICDGVSIPKRPANKRFFELMHDYFTRIADKNSKKSCSECTEEQCPQLKRLHKRISELEKENAHLTHMLGELRGQQ